jgi:hypothetical protein
MRNLRHREEARTLASVSEVRIQFFSSATAQDAEDGNRAGGFGCVWFVVSGPTKLTWCRRAAFDCLHRSRARLSRCIPPLLPASSEMSETQSQARLMHLGRVCAASFAQPGLATSPWPARARQNRTTSPCLPQWPDLAWPSPARVCGAARSRVGRLNTRIAG